MPGLRKKKSARNEDKRPAIQAELSGFAQAKEIYLSLKALYKKGFFEHEDTLKLAQKLYKITSSLPDEIIQEDYVSYYKMRFLSYEVRDYFNLISDEESGKILTEGEHLYRTLRVAPQNISPVERESLREKIRFCLIRVRELHRREQYEQAQKELAHIEEIVKGLICETSSLWGTQGTVSYLQGNVLRQLARFDEASEKFQKSCQCYYERAKEKDTEEDACFARWKAGLAWGLGLGFINFTRGYLTNAYQCIIPAQVFLLKHGGKIHQGYLNLIRASIERAFAGKDKAVLHKEVIPVLKECLVTFEKHKRYHSRTSYELALAYFYADEFDQATKMIEQVYNFSLEAGDNEWVAKALVVWSHISRNKGLGANINDRHHFDEAVRKADEACSLLSNLNQEKREALLARGQAKVARGSLNFSKEDFESAEGDFLTALAMPLSDREEKRDRVNPKISAMCYLSLVDLCIKQKDREKGKDYLAKWRPLKPLIEHDFIKEFARKKEAELDDLDVPFEIRDPSTLNFQEHISDLRKWLLARALREAKGDKSKAAELLSVARKTIYEWGKEK